MRKLRGTLTKKEKVHYRRRIAAAHEIEYELKKQAKAPFEGDAHMFLMGIYKDPTKPLELRMEAASKALPYEKPRLMAMKFNDQQSPLITDGVTVRFIGAPEEPVTTIEHDAAEVAEPRRKLRFVS